MHPTGRPFLFHSVFDPNRVFYTQTHNIDKNANIDIRDFTT